MLEAAHISKKYGSLEVLKDVNLSLTRGEIVSIVGSSGAGKSTLLHILGTLDQADSGTILLNGTALHTLTGAALATFRNRNLGFIFQFHHLLPEFTALENVCIPAWIAGTDKQQCEERAVFLLGKLGLAGKERNRPGELSGGEQQRVAVARAIINNPALLLADEPTGALDSRTTKEVLDLFEALHQGGMTVVMVTHEDDVAARAQEVVQFRDGAIATEVSPSKLP